MNPPKILLGVTGSVAAKLTPQLAQRLAAVGEVRIAATRSSFYFWSPCKVPCSCWDDDSEWPRGAYVKDQDIPHISLGDWADVLVIAPLTANTAAKLALGLSDNLLTCAYCAWPEGKPVLLAPAMNTRMWENPLTQRHLEELAGRPRHEIVEPVVKKLACGTTGMGAMAALEDIEAAVRLVLA